MYINRYSKGYFFKPDKTRNCKKEGKKLIYLKDQYIALTYENELGHMGGDEQFIRALPRNKTNNAGL